MKKSKITKRVKKNNSKGKTPRRLKSKEVGLFSPMTTDIEVYAWNAWAREQGF